jgi:hypothetical protein
MHFVDLVNLMLTMAPNSTIPAQEGKTIPSSLTPLMYSTYMDIGYAVPITIYGPHNKPSSQIPPPPPPPIKKRALTPNPDVDEENGGKITLNDFINLFSRPSLRRNILIIPSSLFEFGRIPNTSVNPAVDGKHRPPVYQPPPPPSNFTTTVDSFLDEATTFSFTPATRPSRTQAGIEEEDDDDDDLRIHRPPSPIEFAKRTPVQWPHGKVRAHNDVSSLNIPTDRLALITILFSILVLQIFTIGTKLNFVHPLDRNHLRSALSVGTLVNWDTMMNRLSILSRIAKVFPIEPPFHMSQRLSSCGRPNRPIYPAPSSSNRPKIKYSALTFHVDGILHICFVLS